MKTILKTRRLSMETLENRQMLAASPVVELRNLCVPPGPALPCAKNVVLVKESLRVIGGAVVFPKKMDFTAISGSLSQNATNLRLLAVYGNGQEIVMGSGTATANAASVVVDKPYWLSYATQFKLVADMSQDMVGNKLTVKLTKAEFLDQSDKVVPAENVRYCGFQPTTVGLLSNTAHFDQAWQPETTVVYAGQKNIQLLRFNAWTDDPARPTALQNVSFVVSQGSLVNGTNYSLLEDGKLLQSGVRPRNGKISFNLGRGVALDGGHMFTINCDGSSVPATNPNLAIAFSTLSVKELRTGKLLVGTGFNGGAGQVRVETRQSPLFIFHPAPTSGLYVSEVTTLPQERWSAGAKDVVFDTANFFTKTSGVNITQVVLGAEIGSLRNAENWELWETQNGVSRNIATGHFVGDNVVFDFLFHIDAGASFKMEIRADVVSSNLVTPTLQTKLSSVSAVFDNFAQEPIILANAAQPIMILS